MRFKGAELLPTERLWIKRYHFFMCSVRSHALEWACAAHESAFLPASAEQSRSSSVFLGLPCRALLSRVNSMLCPVPAQFLPQAPSRASIVREPISMLWHLSFYSSWYQGLSLFSLAILNLSSHHFFILPKVLSKQSLMTAGLIVSWPNSLFSEPSVDIYILSFHLSTLTRIPWRNSEVWVAINNHFHLIFVGQSFLVLFLQNATPHGIWPCTSMDAASLFTQLVTSLPTSWSYTVPL